MEIVKKTVAPTPTKQATSEPEPSPSPSPSPSQEVTTLPKTLPQRPTVRTQQVAPARQVAPVPLPLPEVQQQPQIQAPFATPQPEQPQEYDDGIYMRDPRTGQTMSTELDQLDMDALGGDPLRAIYQALVWAAESFKKLAMTTPALASLSPDAEKVIDQVATLGYQVTNAGAEVTRGLWNWPFSRVMVNQQLDSVIHGENWRMFDQYYREWYTDLIAPVEQGTAQYDAQRIKEWVDKRKDAIADPGTFVKLCSQRYAMDKIAAKSAFQVTDVLSTTRPVGVRQKTTTGLEAVFKKRPG